MNVKNKLKSFLPLLPPILFDKLFYINRYIAFKKYKALVSKNSELKDIHQGKRGFILGSGPSIKKENLKPLKNEIVFALNNFYVHPDFQEIMGGDVEKYYITAPTHLPQTEQEWRNWFIGMEKNMPCNATMIFGLNGYKGNIKYIFDKYNIFQQHKIYWYFSGVNVGEYYSFNKRHIDIINMIWAAEAVSVYALIIAIYMGFNEIILLGMDHDYFLYDDEKEMRMYSSAIHQKDEFKRTFDDSFYIKEFLRQYRIFCKYALLQKKYKGKVFNASNGGILKVFPQKKLMSFFDYDEKFIEKSDYHMDL
ncbi:MAG: hypothetical protein DRQ57_05250 [Gammaproteobacteria bacterium]|nr:MAG: hypothetical protein DRQ57_05250 [Gammaproteobacteria bacterium]